MKKLFLTLTTLASLSFVSACGSPNQNLITDREGCKAHLTLAHNSDVLAAQKVTELPKGCIGCADTKSCDARVQDLETKIGQIAADIDAAPSEDHPIVKEWNAQRSSLRSCLAVVKTIRQDRRNAAESRNNYDTCVAKYPESTPTGSPAPARGPSAENSNPDSNSPDEGLFASPPDQEDQLS